MRIDDILWVVGVDRDEIWGLRFEVFWYLEFEKMRRK